MIDFTAFDGTIYDGYMFVLSNIIPATDNVSFFTRLSNDGGGSFRSGGADYRQTAYLQGSDGASQGFNDATGASEISLIQSGSNVGSAANEDGISATVYVHGPHLTGVRTRIRAEIVYTSMTNVLMAGFTGAEVMAQEANDAIRFQFSSGTIESGTITMYGLRNA